MARREALNESRLRDRRPTVLAPALVGDRAQRVTVGLPATFQELEIAAQRHFGRNGPPGMYHHGKVHLVVPPQVKALKHDDVVVITMPEFSRDPPVATYAADYVRHPLDPCRPPPPRVPFPKLPFNADTSYHTDYVRHPLEPPKAAEAWRPRPPLPFEGHTTYGSDYLRHPPAFPEPARKPPPREAVPFLGDTEYHTQYLKHRLESKPIIHLEPEYGRYRRLRPRTSVASSASTNRTGSRRSAATREPRPRRQHRRS